MDRSKQGSNKDLVLKAFDTLFNQRDYSTAETFWSPHYSNTVLTSNLEERALLPRGQCLRYFAL